LIVLTRFVEILLRFYRTVLAWLANFIRLAMALASVLIGIGLVMLFMQLQQNPDFLVPSRPLLARLQLLPFLEKFEKLSAKVTHSARVTVLADNMHRMQKMLETYPVTGGNYPDTVSMLYQDAAKDNYWWGFRNPFDEHLIKDYREWMADYQDYQFQQAKESFRGKVLYEPIGVPAYGYRIYACDDLGQLITHQDGSPYILTNRPEL